MCRAVLTHQVSGLDFPPLKMIKIKHLENRVYVFCELRATCYLRKDIFQTTQWFQRAWQQRKKLPWELSLSKISLISIQFRCEKCLKNYLERRNQLFEKCLTSQTCLVDTRVNESIEAYIPQRRHLNEIQAHAVNKEHIFLWLQQWIVVVL